MTVDLLGHRDAIVEALSGLLPSSVTVSGIPGRFDLAELERYAVKAPAVLVAVLSGTGVDDRGDVSPKLEVAGYVLTKNGRGGVAAATGLKLVSVLLHVIRGRQLSPESQTATGLAFRNLHSTGLGEEGVWLAAVTWSQVSPLTQEADDTLTDFLRLQATYDLAPADATPEATNLINVRAPA